MTQHGDSMGGRMVNRLTSRLERSQLQRQAMPGGGAVFRGQIASRALRAVGARAMTIDRQIIVSDDFDPSRPEDQALYAHERYHAEQGDGQGGGGGSNFRDAEEIAARAVERMVLQRAMSGGYEGGYQPGAGAGASSVSGPANSGGQGVSAGAHPQLDSGKKDDTAPNSERGYQALRAKGYSHLDLVEELSRRVLTMMEEGDFKRDDSFGDLQGTI